jgi:aminopeptidase N
MKTEVTRQPIFLKDYRKPDFQIPTLHLTFALGEETTLVTARSRFERDPSAGSAPLVLMGEGLTPRSVKIDGRTLAAKEYVAIETGLTIANVPDQFELEIETEIQPQNNLSCEGLYKSSGMFCTQCEAESFRKITYFLDRPDVMSTFTVTIQADKTKYPILLSNGNPISRRDLGPGPDGNPIHEVVWHDPFKKPAYLFALVAGDLGVIEDSFTTRSGRKVKLQIFARHGLQQRCGHAMNSLKWSLKWDEDTYGLEYDLDIFMIVVAEDFNMGAMENKGLNIFNANYILANPETATDSDYDSITAVVGHEYFHNWTGNRVTCRDWFQLSLKEGLTVFRDQRFSADMGSAAVKRIEEVIRLRTHQFAEDAGPMAHPVRPQSYISIDNFYTLTIYEKGAEVIRMIETIVGRAGFRKGMDLYFKRHDGQAVTTDDFVAAMADANKVDLQQFKNWYNQAGTPQLNVKTDYDAAKAAYTITIEQSAPPTPGQSEKKPYHIPVAIGLLGRDGRDLKLNESGATTQVLEVRESKQSFVFNGIKEKPVLSLLRGFSAPVKAEFNCSDEELAFLMAHDSDSFARWEAAQLLTVRVTKELVAGFKKSGVMMSAARLTQAFGPLLKDEKLDPAFVSFMLALPAEQYLAQFFTVVDVDAIHAVRENLLSEIAKAHRGEFQKIYDRLTREGTEGVDPKLAGQLAGQLAGRRALRSCALEYLAMSGDTQDFERALKQRREAKNMTEELGALQALNRSPGPARKVAMDEFYEKWNKETLVINKWLSIQAISPLKDTLERIKNLSDDPVFDKKNPNKIYALYLAFSRFNTVRFNDKSGDGYRFIADQVMDIDSRNPQVAARLMGGFNQWRALDPHRQELMKTELNRILAKPGLSSNVFEIASKSLNS